MTLYEIGYHFSYILLQKNKLLLLILVLHTYVHPLLLFFKLDAPANCHVVSHLRILPYSGQIICRMRDNSNGCIYLH